MSSIQPAPSLAAIAETQTVGNGDDKIGEIDAGLQKPDLRRSAAVVIAVTLQRLVDDASRFWAVEERLVLDALRRSSKALNNADVEELSEYVAALSPDQLRGVTSNVKGIFHELLFVYAENTDGDEITGRIFEATNHPGADVEFIVNGETIGEVQLKAVATATSIMEHLARYPEINILATTEIADKITAVGSSGFLNSDLTANVNDAFLELPGDSIATEIFEGVATSTLVSGALAAGRVIREKQINREQVKKTLGDVAVGAVTATSLEILLGGIF